MKTQLWRTKRSQSMHLLFQSVIHLAIRCRSWKKIWEYGKLLRGLLSNARQQ